MSVKFRRRKLDCWAKTDKEWLVGSSEPAILEFDTEKDVVDYVQKCFPASIIKVWQHVVESNNVIVGWVILVD
jgi:hypothetical protein